MTTTQTVTMDKISTYVLTHHPKISWNESPSTFTKKQWMFRLKCKKTSSQRKSWRSSNGYLSTGDVSKLSAYVETLGFSNKDFGIRGEFIYVNNPTLLTTLLAAVPLVTSNKCISLIEGPPTEKHLSLVSGGDREDDIIKNPKIVIRKSRLFTARATNTDGTKKQYPYRVTINLGRLGDKNNTLESMESYFGGRESLLEVMGDRSAYDINRIISSGAPSWRRYYDTEIVMMFENEEDITLMKMSVANITIKLVEYAQLNK